MRTDREYFLLTSGALRVVGPRQCTVCRRTGFDVQDSEHDVGGSEGVEEGGGSGGTGGSARVAVISDIQTVQQWPSFVSPD